MLANVQSRTTPGLRNDSILRLILATVFFIGAIAWDSGRLLHSAVTACVREQLRSLHAASVAVGTAIALSECPDALHAALLSCRGTACRRFPCPALSGRGLRLPRER